MLYIINISQDNSKINHYLSNTLLNNIQKTLENKSKVILYLNRRWQFSSLICKDCSMIYKCKFCDISLSVHKFPQKLLCHTCNYEKEVPIKCEKCNWKNLEKIWVWTQQIEESLVKIFPDKNIYRFDIDSLKNKTWKNEALENLNKADIIIWTKMITTGFDFKNIWLIGVVLLEQGLSIPKYDAEENLYFNIKQLIGRWERRGEKTDIFIQTFIPQNETVKSIWENNYKEFFKRTLKERKQFNYPPFCEIATLEYRDRNKNKAEEFIKRLKNKLDIENPKKQFEIILFPEPQKKYNSYHYKILIKWKKIRKFLQTIKPEIMRNSNLVVIF